MAASAAMFVAWQISTLRAPPRRQATSAAPKDDGNAKILALDVAILEAAWGRRRDHEPGGTRRRLLQLAKSPGPFGREINVCSLPGSGRHTRRFRCPLRILAV